MHSYLRVIAPLFLIIIFMAAKGQSSGTKKPDFSMRLHPGDAVPDVSFSNVKNWSGKPLRLADFKGKLLILDFWTVNCSPCIAAMPKMEELQRKFDGNLQVVMVTPNSKAAVEKLTERSKILQRTTLPAITGDTLLGKLFPYTGTPTHVWIGKDGKLMFITDGYNTSTETVQRYLNGSPLAVKHRVLQPGVEVDVAATINDPDKSDLRCYSIFTGLSKITAQSSDGLLLDTANKVVGFKAVNMPLHGLLIARFAEDNDGFDNGLYLPNRTIWKVRNKYPYAYPEDKSLEGEWREQYLYCYELKLPKETSVEDVHTYLANDLKRYFNVSARLENHRMKCFVLIRTSTDDKIKTKGGKHLFYSQEDYSGFEGVSIRPLDFMIHTFGEANLRSALPVVDGTHYTGRIDITINADIRDLPAVRKELKKYDLDIVEREEIVPMIVIAEEK
ncbi:MAG: TlpA family protein disulfide reductase [Williamsia sp.]|nr:TlpA family protein disulfide reductase [Williamsia sp.]